MYRLMRLAGNVMRLASNAQASIVQLCDRAKATMSDTAIKAKHCFQEHGKEIVLWILMTACFEGAAYLTWKPEESLTENIIPYNLALFPFFVWNLQRIDWPGREIRIVQILPPNGLIVPRNRNGRQM